MRGARGRVMASVRVAIIADTHGFLDPRVADAVMTCDLAVHCGDIGGAAVLAGLRPRSGRVVAVRGNNDVPGGWPDAERRNLDGLPVQCELDLPGGCLVVVHGDRLPAADRHARLRRAYPQAHAVAYGHSHRMVCDRTGRPWVLNPGAGGRVRTFGGPSCLLLDAATAGWTVHELRFPKLRVGH